MILRWVFALGLVFLAGYGVIEFKRATLAWALADTEEEILAYEVTQRHGSVFELAAGLERVLVSTYGVLSAQAAAERAREEAELSVSYGIVADLLDENGKPCDSRVYETVSRVHLDTKGNAAAPVARLAYSSDKVSDPRTMTVDIRPCARAGGRLELRAADGDVSRVLLRVSQVEVRAPLERELVSRRLGPERRAEIVEARASLGFSDLPSEVQQRAVAGWRRRIGAVGQTGVDYVQRRLLLQKYVSSPPAQAVMDSSVEVGPGRVAAVNVLGPTRFGIQANAGQIVTVADEGEAVSLRVPETGELEVELKGEGARTVEIGAPVFASLQLLAEANIAKSLLGEPELLPALEGRVRVHPDRVRQKALRLHPERPIIFRVPPGQPFFGVSVRARLLDSLRLDGSLPLPALVEGTLRARWDVGATADTRVQLGPSRFDHFADDHFATEVVTLLLNPPPGAQRLELYGDEILNILAWTSEPGVDESKVLPSYQVELEEDVVWRSARYEKRTWAPLWPENIETLQVAGSVLALVTQPRLRRVSAEAEPLPERALSPARATLRRHLLTERLVTETEALTHAWAPFDELRARVNIPAEGAEAGLLQLVYRASPASLDAQMSLVVDGVTVQKVPLVLLSGRLRAEVTPGVREVELRGVKSDTLAFARAAPARGGRIVRSHAMFALTRSEPLTFVVEAKAGAPQLLVLVVATEGKRSFRLGYSIDGGKPVRTAGFYRRSTQEAGVLMARSGDAGSGLLWEVDREVHEARKAPDGIAKLRILLGDDLRPGRHEVKVRLLGVDGGRDMDPTLWVRAVLVGSESEGMEDEVRWWAQEVLP